MYNQLSNITGIRNLLANIVVVAVVTLIAVACVAILCNLGAFAGAKFGLIG